MNRLESQFYQEIDFIHLDVDNAALSDARTALRIRGRSEYVLFDAEGNEIGRWFGALAQHTGDIFEALETASQN